MNEKNKILYQDDNTTKFEIISPKYGTFQTTVDTEDVEKIKNYKWRINYDKNLKRISSIRASNGYKQNSILLHSFITGHKYTDHINGNIFNNRKENLRECTKQQNNKNVKTHRDNKSGYKGIDKIRDKWRARITCNYKTITIGTYADIKDAINAYNKKAIELFGEFSRLNSM